MRTRGLINRLVDDSNAKAVHCQRGSVYWREAPGGRFYVTATGHRAMTVPASDLSHIVQELTQSLGG